MVLSCSINKDELNREKGLGYKMNAEVEATPLYKCSRLPGSEVFLSCHTFKNIVLASRAISSLHAIFTRAAKASAL